MYKSAFEKKKIKFETHIAGIKHLPAHAPMTAYCFLKTGGGVKVEIIAKGRFQKKS